MRGIRRLTIALTILTTITLSGCRSTPGRRPATIVSPPPVVGETDSVVGGKTISPAPVQTVGFADRHPLFAKPREYWETSGDNKVVKAVAATVIGVPAGVVGEFRQIIVGAPPRPRY